MGQPRAPPAAKGLAKSSHGLKPKPAGGLVNVNTATAEELEALPGIGPVIARRIVQGRPYRSVEDLGRVKGIGKRRLEEIRPLVTADERPWRTTPKRPTLQVPGRTPLDPTRDAGHNRTAVDHWMLVSMGSLAEPG
jgi:competence ComEA-like helix-hairpin-helix protein